MAINQAAYPLAYYAAEIADELAGYDELTDEELTAVGDELEGDEHLISLIVQRVRTAIHNLPGREGLNLVGW